MKKAFVMMAVLVMAAAAQATVVGSDNFTYSDGALVGASGSTWANISGAAGTLLVAGNQLEVQAARAEDAVLALTGAPYSTGDLYFSFSLTMSALPSAGGTYFAMLGNGTSNFRDRLYAFNGSGTTYSLGINNGNVVGATWGSALSLNTTYLIVGRSDLTTDTTYLWVDPVSEASTSISFQSNSTVNVNWFGIRQATGEGNMTLDNLLVGTTFADVSAPIPEPATMGLLGLGALALILRRKMKN
jgi:hypothetical protein